jgi:hypothetical protein
LFADFVAFLCTKFEPERFVDGLLGIGAAGGKSSGSEGAMLAARLKGLRKERSERAPKLKMKEAVSQAFGAKPEGIPPPLPPRKPTRRNKSKKNKR